MLVKVEVMPWLSELVTRSISRKALLEVNLPEGASLRHLLFEIGAEHGRLRTMVFDERRGQLTGHAEIAINGVLYDQAGGLDAVLRDGDTIALLPGIAGGTGE